MIPECLIITNPTSGQKKAPRLAEKVLQCLGPMGLQAEIKVTQRPQDTHLFAREAARQGIRIVAGCGGDGTLQSIAHGIQDSSAILGILPQGRCNDLAHALGFQKEDPPDLLAETLAKGQEKEIDLGLFEPLEGTQAQSSRVFCTVATLGFDSQVSRYVETHKMRLKGTKAYFLAAIKTIIPFKGFKVCLRGDFGTFEGCVFMAATCNSRSYGGRIKIAPFARLDDGSFDICMIRQTSKWKALLMFPKVIRGAHVKHDLVRFFSSRTVEIKTPEGPQWICADGETLGQTPARLKVLARAIRVKIKTGFVI